MVDRLLKLLRTIRATGLGDGGVASRSVAESLRRAMLYGLVGWNVLLAAVVAVGDPRISPLLMVALHLLLIVVAVGCLRGYGGIEVCLALGYGLWLVDYLAARSMDDAITLAACWLGNLLYMGSAIALTHRGRTWFPIVGSVTVVAVLVTVSPVWRLEEASAFVVTALTIVVVVRVAMTSLWGLAEQADLNIEQLEEERQEQEVLRRTGDESAEDARLLHDTVVNTLGAVANGVSTVDRADVVRARCRGDLRVVEGLLEGRRGQASRRLTEIGDGIAGVELVRTGLTGSDLDELQDVLAPEVVDALVGSADEAIRNAGKHARAETVRLDLARVGSEVIVTVVDDGVGFEADASAGHGIERSIRGRVAAVGGKVDIASRPGEGTRVTISSSVSGGGPTRTSAADLATDVDGISGRLIRRACWLLSVGAVVVGFVIEAANRPGQLTWTYAMLALVASCLGIAGLASRRTGRLPAPVVALLVAAFPVGFVAAVAGIDFGRTEVITFQAIGISSLILILLALGHLRAALTAGALLVGTTAVLSAVMWADSASYGAVVVVGAAPSLGLAVGWWYFEKLVVRVVAESENARVLAAQASVEVASRREIEAARRRWGTASLERSADLLRGLGTGGLDLDDPGVRAACGAEEGYLRQLLLLSPSSYRMSGWFAHALAAARSRGVRLTIRSGDQDAPDDAAAGAIGGLVLRSVASAAEGADVTVGWFPTTAGTRLIIVGPPTGDDAGESELPPSWRVSRTVLADQEVAEVIVA
ncbi:hypothetical protein EFK50_18665 [Nocardioides marmoriginsengisoli]|uniref:histidine kinase n=1 Tax=Nocardioides marmoriginsengisoli TaxID=661483 RepID=A0A3N0CAN7_9ACTN|nr:ATP-binding protein [Nocardioides marmoriginsengisoli]RNL60369.1 hypothetical protein EFK50_18665 [Nocardioides marmoriginsengisoli]